MFFNRLASFSFMIFLSLVLVLGCKTKEKQTSDNAPTVLVQLYDDASVSALENDYKKYNLTKQKVVSRPMHIFLFTFNSEKITDVALVEELRKSELVKEAQQNRDVQIRN